MASNSKRTKVFISYSHRDFAALEELQVHLKPLERQKLLDRWDDTKIEPGQKWRDEIQKALNEARVAVLLVSGYFLASDFIAEDELPELLEAAESEGLLVLPMIVSHCLFTDTPSLAQFQAVNNPKQPLEDLPKNQQNKEWTNLARQIRTSLKEPLANSNRPKRENSDSRGQRISC